MIGKYIENAVQNQPVVGLFPGLFGKSHVQQRIQAGSAGVLVCRGFQVPSIGIDGEIVGFSEEIFSEPFHADKITPLATLFLHELLQLVGNLLLPGCQPVNDAAHIVHG